MFHSHVSFICSVSIPVCRQRLSRATMDRHLKGPAPLSCCARAIQIPVYLLGHIHVRLTHLWPHPPVTSTEVKTYLHTLTIALTFHGQPHWRLTVHSHSTLHFPHSPFLPTNWSVSTSTALTTFFFLINLQIDISNICLRFYCNTHVSVAL